MYKEDKKKMITFVGRGDILRYKYVVHAIGGLHIWTIYVMSLLILALITYVKSTRYPKIRAFSCISLSSFRLFLLPSIVQNLTCI
jgi:hypothetical protein